MALRHWLTDVLSPRPREANRRSRTRRTKPRRPFAERFAARLVVKPLEDRLVLNAGSLWFDATAGNDQIEILQTASSSAEGLAGPQIELWMNGQRQLQVAAEEVSDITVRGLGGDDTLTVNYAGSGGFFEQIVTFHGGDQVTPAGDELVLVGGPFVSIEHVALSSSDGRFDIDGVTRIVYTELEPIQGGDASNRIFTFGDNGTTITLTDATGANMTIASPADSETTTFPNPTSLTINAAGGDDTITITSVDTAFAGSLVINGGDGTDAVNLNSDITFAANRSLTVTADGLVAMPNNVDLVTSGTGTISLSAGTLTMGNNATLQSASSTTVSADDISIGGGSAAITAGSGTVTLQPLSTNRPVNLGANAAGTLGLTDTELDRVTSGTLNIGLATGDAITISSAIGLADPTNVTLRSSSTISFNNSFNTNNGNLTLNGAAVNVAATGTDVTVGAANTLAFANGTDLNIAINGTTVDTQYEQLNVAGLVNLTDVDLVLSGTHTPTTGQTFVIVANDGADAITGTFNGLAQGATISNFLGAGFDATISYTGGSGNDVVITVGAPAFETSVTLSGGNVTITDVAGGTSNDQLTIAINGANLRVSDPNNTLGAGAGTTQVDANTVDIPLASLTGSLTVETLAGNDSVTFTGAAQSYAGGVSIDAGTGTDTVSLNAVLSVGTTSGAFSVSAETINVGANVTATGNQTYTGAVSVTANVQLTSGAALSFGNTVALGANNLTVRADDVDLGGNFSGTGSVAIAGNDVGDALQLGGTPSDAANQVELSSTEITRLAAGGNRTGLTFGRADGTGTATINGFSLSAASSNLTILAGQIVDGGGAIAMGTGDARLVATSGIGSSPDPIEFTGLTDVAALTATGGLFLRNATSGNVNVTSVGGTNGLSTTTSGNVVLTNAAGAITLTNNVAAAGGGTVLLSATTNLTANADVTTTNAAIDFSVGGTTTLNADADVNAGNAVVTLATNELAIDATASVSSGTQRTIVRPLTGGGAIGLVLGANPATANTLELSDAELDRITAGVLELGSAATGSVTFSGAISPGGTNTLHLKTGATIVDSNAGLDVTVANLAVESVTGIAATGSDSPALETSVTNLAYVNTTSGNVSFADNSALNIASVDGVTTSSNGGTGTTTLSAAGALAFLVNVTSGGTLTATTTDTGGADTDNLSVAAGVTVQATGANANVVLRAADRISLPDTSLVRATGTGGNVTLESGFGDMDDDGSQSLAGAVTAVGTITLNLNAESGSATTTGTAALTAASLRLLSTTSGGSFDLDAGTHDVNTLAAATDGAIEFADTDDLAVGTVTTVGITTTNDAVTLCATTLTLSQKVAAGSGTVRLQATTGAVNQTAGAITAGSLGVRAATAIGLGTATNDVDTFAAAAGTTLSFVDADGYSLGTVTASSCFTPTVTGLTSGGNLELCVVTGDLNVNAALTATGQTVRLQADSGSITQNAAGIITAANLGARATANVDLDAATNAVSTTFAAASTTAGSVEFRNGSAITVGSVAAGACFTATSGLSTQSGSAALTSTTGGVAFANTSSVMGDLTVVAAGDITDNANVDLTVTGTASFTADNAGNTAAIVLGDVSNNTLNFGSLTFVSDANTSIDEDSDTQLTGTSTVGGNLMLVSRGNLTDDANADLSVTGTAGLTADAPGNTAVIVLGDAANNDVNFGSLTFVSDLGTTITEDSAVVLVGSSSAQSLVLTAAAGSITDDTATGADLAIANNATFIANGAGGSITLGDDAGNSSAFGTLTFNSVGAVSISEDNALVLTGASTALSLVLTAEASSISEDANADLAVTNNASFTANGAGGSITLGAQAGNADTFGTLTFASGGAVSISEDDAVELTGTNTAQSLVLTAEASTITDDANADVTVTNNARFTANGAGGSITLGDQGGNADSFGTLTFNSVGAVSLSEDNAVALTGASTALSLVLTAELGTITDDANADLSVTNNAHFTANGAGGSITVGDQGGNADSFGTLTFNSVGAVSLSEDNAVELTGASTALSLVLTAESSTITDDANADLNVTGNASFAANGAGGSITLGDQGGNTDLFGTLTFNSVGAVSLSEDNAVELTGASTALSLLLTAESSTITDDANADLTVTNNASFTANGAGGSITLGDDIGNADSFGTLTFESVGAVSISEDNALVLSGASTALGLVLTAETGSISEDANADLAVTNNASFAANGAGGSIMLGAQAGNSDAFGTLTFASVGAVSISEDDAVVLTGTSTAQSLVLTAEASTIANDANADLTVTNNANFTANGAGGSITLGDQGGNADSFGTLTFNSVGAVSISEDDTVVLAGASSALSLVLTAEMGSITDESTADLTVTNNADFTANGASGSITLGDDAGNADSFGTLTFNSTGAVSISEDNALVLANASTALSLVLTAETSTITDDTATNADLTVTNNARFIANGAGGAITLGDDAGNADSFGSLTFNSVGAVNISEDNAIVLANTSTALSLVLTAETGSITDDTGTSLTVTNAASLQGGDILLGDQPTDVLHFGEVTLTGDAVSIVEDSSTLLAGVTATSLFVGSGGAITDSGAITVTNQATFSAATTIVLGDTTTANFGSLGLVGTEATVTEASSTDLNGVDVDLLTLTTPGPLTDSGNVDVSGLAVLNVTGQTITLGDAGETTNFGRVSLTAATVNVAEDSSTEFDTVAATTLTWNSAGSITDRASLVITGAASLTATNAITLGDGAAETVNFGTIALSAGGAVSIVEDSDTLLKAVAVGSLRYESVGSIENTDQQVQAAGSLVLVAAVDITIHDVPGLPAGDSEVVGDSVRFEAGGTNTIENLALLESSTGKVTNAPPLLRIAEDNPNDVLLPGDPTQEVSGTLGGIFALGDNQEFAENLTITVIWGDGVVSQLSGLNAGDTLDWRIGPNGASTPTIVPGGGTGPINVFIQREYPLVFLQLLQTQEVVSTFVLSNDPRIVLVDGTGVDLNSTVPLPIATTVSEDLTNFRPPIAAELVAAQIALDAPARPVLSNALPPSADKVTTYDEIQVTEDEGEQQVAELFLVRVGPDGKEGPKVKIPLEQLRDLDKLLDKLRKAEAPSGLYRLYHQEPGLPPRMVFEVRKSGLTIGDPVREPGRGGNPLDKPVEMMPAPNGQNAAPQNENPSPNANDGAARQPTAESDAVAAAWAEANEHSFTVSARLRRRYPR